jgi:hypothetical protein
VLGLPAWLSSFVSSGSAGCSSTMPPAHKHETLFVALFQ